MANVTAVPEGVGYLYSTGVSRRKTHFPNRDNGATDNVAVPEAVRALEVQQRRANIGGLIGQPRAGSLAASEEGVVCRQFGPRGSSPAGSAVV